MAVRASVKGWEPTGASSGTALIRQPDVVAPRPRLLDRVRMAIRVRQYSPRTEKAYVRWVVRFVRFHANRHPADMGEPEVTRFLSALAIRGRVSASTQNQALSALLFLYKEVLGRNLSRFDAIVRARRPVRLPVVLSREEVAGVLGRLRGTPGSWRRCCTDPACGSSSAARFG